MHWEVEECKEEVESMAIIREMSEPEHEYLERQMAERLLRGSYDFAGTHVYRSLWVPQEDLAFWLKFLDWTLEQVCEKKTLHLSSRYASCVRDMYELRTLIANSFQTRNVGEFLEIRLMYAEAFWLIDALQDYIQDREEEDKASKYLHFLTPYHERYFFDELKKHSMGG
ncbi:hypothetical protein ACOJUR_15375 [Alicyclobacillus tolerans]|uniref:hypothetical protein n=1 Tax=Alicyclobacillus tolerans TaxID=90970 RepID=UPI003B7B6B1A